MWYLTQSQNNCLLTKFGDLSLLLPWVWVQAARARTWRPESPHGSRLSYLPWLISCGLFRLNPEAWGDAPTIPTTNKINYNHLAILKHHHHKNEYNFDNNNYNTTQQTFVLMKTSWKRLSSQSSRHLDQDEYIRLSDTSSEDVFIKTNTSVQAICFKTSSRRFQGVFKTSSKCLQDVSQKRLQDIFKASSRRLKGIFKTSCKDVCKTFWRRIIRLNCLPSSSICLDHTSEKFMVSVENLQVW